VSLSTLALDIKKAVFRGQGCPQGASLQTLEGDQFLLPLDVSLQKKSSRPIERKSCQMRWPVALKATEKLQISMAEQSVEIKAIKGTPVKASLNISLVGKKSKILSVEAESSVTRVLKSEALIVESDCGKDAIITADFNVFAKGSAEASAKSEA